MSRARRWLGLVLAGGLAACAPAPAAPPTPTPLPLVATEMAAPLAAALAEAYRLAAPAVLPSVREVPQTALAGELATGQAALAITASPFAGQFITPVGVVELVLVTAPAQPLPVISAAQARAVFTGQASDWAQLGGAPGGLQPVAREAASDGARAWEQALTLPAEALAPNTRLAPTWAAMRALVAETPAAVGYLPLGEVDASVMILRLEAPLTLTLFAMAPAEPAGAARDFLAWAQSPAGQAAAAQLGQALP